MAVRPIPAVAAAVVAGALGLGALGWAAGALAGSDDDGKGRCRGYGGGQEQPADAAVDRQGL